MEDTSENNCLIAEFMGFTCCDTGQDRFWNPPSMPAATVDKWEYHSNHLDEFQNSWDWLMPVVEKIWRIPTPYPDGHEARTTVIESAILTIDIKDAHWAVVEFIKWFNSQGK